MPDFALQRRNMVESQVRPSDVTDRRVIGSMLDVPREEFVPDALRPMAYSDAALKLPLGSPGAMRRALLPPRTLAKLIDLARIEPGEVVLDIGAACGYGAAVLSHLAETVVALEPDAELGAFAARALTAHNIDNVAIVQGELHKGWPSAAPYDVIILEGSVEVVPEDILAQVADGGRLVAVVADGALTRAQLWRRRKDGFDCRAAFEVAAEPLPGFNKVPAFHL